MNDLAFSAGFVTRTLKLTCGECVSDLASDTTEIPDTISVITIKDRGGLITPAKSVFDLCLLSEKVLREIVNSQGLKPNTFSIVHCKTLEAAIERRLHMRFTCAEHAVSLVHAIINRYLMVRVKHEASKATSTDKTVRSKLNKLVLFQNV